MNLPAFVLGQLSDHWRKALWMVIGAGVVFVFQ